MSQLSMLPSMEPRVERFDLPEADVRLLHRFMSNREAEALFVALRRDVPWRQDKIKFYGKEHLLPRLQQWYGDPAATYTYSGIQMAPEPWSPLLLELKRKVEAASSARFNTVLLNLYRNGTDTVSWHADDEPEFGADPVIASLSLGATRDFVLRHNTRKGLEKTIPLEHGSLLVMAGTTQAEWKHSLPRRKGAVGERINLTFRLVLPTATAPKQRGK
jgi:alkylated DNA repair dioxygenase AlkB